MRVEGTLTTWNDKRGFGYISPAQGGPEVFVHASAFPRDGQPPTVGERLIFTVENCKNRKFRATNLRCPNRRAPAPDRRSPPPRAPETKRLIGLAMSMLVLLGLAAFGYNETSRRSAPRAPQASVPKPVSQPEPSTRPFSAAAGPLAHR